MLLFAETVWALYGLPQAGGGGRQRPRRGRRLHPGPHRRPPRAEARRRADRPQRGEGRACRCRGRWRVLLRASVPPQALSRRSRSSAATSPTTTALGSGLADELADADGFEDLCLRAARGVRGEGPAGSSPSPRRTCATGVLAEMKAHESERLGGWLDGWFSRRDPGADPRDGREPEGEGLGGAAPRPAPEPEHGGRRDGDRHDPEHAVRGVDDRLRAPPSCRPANSRPRRGTRTRSRRRDRRGDERAARRHARRRPRTASPPRAPRAGSGSGRSPHVPWRA